MQKPIDNERGIALLIAIIAIVVVGGLLIGVSTSARLEHRQALNTEEMAQAFAVTELGLSETVANWYAGNFNFMAVMDEVPIASASPQGAGTYAGNIQRLSPELFFLDVTGTSAHGGSRQRLGTFVKLQPLTVEIEASLTTRGGVRRAGNGQIDGTDLPPAGWAACTGTDDTAGIRVPAGGMVDDGGCPTCIDGDPRIEVDPSIDDDTFFNFGDLDWNALTAMATKTGFTFNQPAVGPRFAADGSITSRLGPAMPSCLSMGTPGIVDTGTPSSALWPMIIGSFGTTYGVSENRPFPWKASLTPITKT